MSGCGGTGSCTCGGGGATARSEQDVYKSDDIAPQARINGVPLHGAGESPDPESLRQRAYAELLRQRAQALGLLAADDPAPLDGVMSAKASEAIERLLAQALNLPEPDEPACRRHYEAHGARYGVGERVQVRHVLFAVTPGMPLDALRRHAEALLIQLRCADEAAFAAAARANSNCPSGANGGDLGWLERGDCAPELASALFAQDEGSAHVGVLPRLVSSRFGFHILRVTAREPGTLLPYEAVRGAIVQTLRQQSTVTALRQYLNLCVAEAQIEGLALEGAASALLQ